MRERKETDVFLFRWALNNPHLSLHIAPEARISISTQRKRNGRPKRPIHNITSILENLHLLLRVPSFARWPLNLHFFDRQVYQKWDKHCASPSVTPLRTSLQVLTDFAPPTDAEVEEERKEAEEKKSEAIKKILQEGLMEEEDEEDYVDGPTEEGEEEDVGGEAQGWGIHALPLDYVPLGSYVEKAQNIVSFEREGECVVCLQHLEHDKGLYAICSHHGCEGVGHLDCWSRHLLHKKGEDSDDGVLLPIDGQCPKCHGAVQWADMMKELTLRTRGQKEVEKLLKKKRKAASAKTGKAKEKAPVKEKAPAKDKALARSRALATGTVQTMNKVSATSNISLNRKDPVKERTKARR